MPVCRVDSASVTANRTTMIHLSPGREGEGLCVNNQVNMKVSLRTDRSSQYGHQEESVSACTSKSMKELCLLQPLPL